MLLLFKLIVRKKFKAFLAIVFLLFTFTFIIDNYELTKRIKILTGTLKEEDTSCYGGQSTNESIHKFSAING